MIIHIVVVFMLGAHYDPRCFEKCTTCLNELFLDIPLFHQSSKLIGCVCVFVCLFPNSSETANPNEQRL